MIALAIQLAAFAVFAARCLDGAQHRLREDAPASTAVLLLFALMAWLAAEFADRFHLARPPLLAWTSSSALLAALVVAHAEAFGTEHVEGPIIAAGIAVVLVEWLRRLAPHTPGAPHRRSQT